MGRVYIGRHVQFHESIFPFKELSHKRSSSTASYDQCPLLRDSSPTVIFDIAAPTTVMGHVYLVLT